MNYDELLAPAAKAMRPSGIRKFFDLAADMPHCISLGVGEPDFKTPWSVRDAGIRSLELGRTKYTANSGLKELRGEICNYLQRRFDLHYKEENILVTVGGSEAIDLTIRAVVQPGDEVIIPEPCFVCYEPITQLTGGVPVHIATRAEDQFRLTADQLRAAITPRTKLLIFPYPNNPTGAVMSAAEMEEIAAVLRETNVLVLSDEIYSELTYGLDRHVSIASLPGMAERTIVVNGFSKSYAMTGWRLGYLRAPRWLARRIIAFQSHTTSNPTTFAQYGAIAALEGKADKEVRHMCEEFAKRRDLVYELISAIPGVKCIRPQGAFYLLCDVSSFGMTSEEFCNRLLAEEKLAAIPCCSFGAEGQIRLSYACSEENIRDAAGRLDAFCREHGN